MGKVGGFLGVVAFGCLMAYTMSWTVRGWVAAMMWDQKSPLTCYGSTVMTLRDKHVKLASGTAIEAAGNCEMKLIDCELEAPTALMAAGNARVTVERGSLAGRDAALSAAGNAAVEFSGGTKLAGKIDRGGNARVTGLPDLDRKQAAEDLSKRYSQGACDGVLECYERAEAFGQISGRVLMTVGRDGKISSAKYDRGSAPDAVQKCLIEVAQKKKIENFDGKPGKLACEYGGLFMSKSKMLSIDASFKRD